MSILEEMKKIERRTEIPAFLKRNCLNGNVCEVGVRFAYNLQALAAAQPNLLVGVDHYNVTRKVEQQDTGMNQPKLDEEYGKVFQRFLTSPNVKIFRGTSKQAAFLFPLFFFDYVYVDADHSYEGSYQDMVLWWDRVRQGGVMAGHDYIDTESKAGTPFGVVRAFAEFLKLKKIPAKFTHITQEGHKTWMIFKPDGE